MTDAPKTIERPLSPHLQIYRWPLGMAMSIMHRISGAALAVGLIAVCWMLLAAATGPQAWAVFQEFWLSLPGQVMLFGWTMALFYHTLSGIRHLIWDTGALFDVRKSNYVSYAVLIAAAAMTALFWCAASPWKGE